MRHAARLAAAALLGLVIAGGSAPATAGGPIEARLEYHAYFAGVRVVRADADLAIADGRYRMTFAGGSEGLLDMLWSWRTEAASEGRVSDGRLRPETHRFERHRDEGVRRMVLRYRDGAPPELEESGPPGRNDDQRVPPEMRIGTVDYLSLMAELVAQLSGGADCAHEAALFNGWRRFDVRFAPAAAEGDARVCRFEIARVLPPGAEPERREGVPGWSDEGGAGAPARTERADPVSGTMRFAPAWEGGPTVPVQIDVDGWFGVASAFLESACPLAESRIVTAGRRARGATPQSCG